MTDATEPRAVGRNPAGLEHEGRTSGTVYQTPLEVAHHDPDRDERSRPLRS